MPEKNIIEVVNDVVLNVAITDDTTDPKLFGPEWEDAPDEDVAIDWVRPGPGQAFAPPAAAALLRTVEENMDAARDQVDDEFSAVVLSMAGAGSITELVFMLASSAAPPIPQQDQQKAADFLAAYHQAKADLQVAASDQEIDTALATWQTAVTTATT